MYSFVWLIKKMRICFNLVKLSVNVVLYLVKLSVNVVLNWFNIIFFFNCILLSYYLI